MVRTQKMARQIHSPTDESDARQEHTRFDDGRSGVRGGRSAGGDD
jgi:hypothetical protein